MTRSFRVALVATPVLAARAVSPLSADASREEPFALARPAEVVATIRAACAGCCWETRGREAAVLRLLVDGRYSQHLILTRGAEPADYSVGLGPLASGAHALRLERDRSSAASAGRLEIEDVAFESVAEGSPRYALLAHAPILHARSRSVTRFSDVPLLMWAESEPTLQGTRLRYSVIFSGEDGGTPCDRLMATWGRLTDIEYVYGVELDAAGDLVAAEFQGKDHKVKPFAGARSGRHALLYVVTDNNMLSDRGDAKMRLAPAPIAVDLAGVSREAVMDAHPWTYRISSEEARREGRVAAGARPGSRKVPDPRRFAYLEACAETRDATLAFGVGVSGADGAVQWRDSDAGFPKYRIARSADHFPNGCFRGAVALPEEATGARPTALRLHAFTRAPRDGEAALPKGSGSARLTRVNRLFMLGPDDQPLPSLFSWAGDVALAPDGAPHELDLAAVPAPTAASRELR